MWSTVVAERLGIIGHAEAVERLTKTLGTLETMERHAAERPVLQLVRPPQRRQAHRLAADRRRRSRRSSRRSTTAGSRPGCTSSRTAVPEVADRAEALFDSMDFGFYYRPAVNRIAFHFAPDTGESPCCYDTIVSESRIASYIGIAKGELPAKEYFGAWRTFPDTATGAGRRRSRSASRATYLGVERLRGRLPVRRHCSWSPGLGRQHVRGADAGPVRPRGASGRRAAGRSTTR